MKGINNLDARYLVPLVKRAQAHDSDAFSELYAITYGRQYNYAKNYLNDPDEAWDAVQEVYILALKKLDTLRDPLCINAWLTQINSRICFNIVKNRRQYLAADFDFELESADEELNPETQLLHNTDEALLYQMIDRLPDTQRQVVALRFIRQLSLQQVAEEMECSVSSVTRYIERARESLAQMLKEAQADG